MAIGFQYFCSHTHREISPWSPSTNEVLRDHSRHFNQTGRLLFYDEQFPYPRQSAPDQYPWDSVHWELCRLKAVINFRTKSQFSLDKVNSGVSTRSLPHQSFPKESCWTFHRDTARVVYRPCLFQMWRKAPRKLVLRHPTKSWRLKWHPASNLKASSSRARRFT